MTAIYKAKETEAVTLDEIADTVRQITGQRSKHGIHAVIRAIRLHLERGKSVRLDGLGTWQFRFRKGRMVKAGKFVPQPDKWVLRFKPDMELRKACNHLAEPQEPVWTNGFTLHDVPTRIQRARARRPSISSQTEPAAGCNTRNQDHGQDNPEAPGSPEGAAGGTSSSPDQRPGSDSTPASVETTAGGSAAVAGVPSPQSEPSPTADAGRKRAGAVAQLAGRPAIRRTG